METPPRHETSASDKHPNKMTQSEYIAYLKKKKENQPKEPDQDSMSNEERFDHVFKNRSRIDQGKIDYVPGNLAEEDQRRAFKVSRAERGIEDNQYGFPQSRQQGSLPESPLGIAENKPDMIGNLEEGHGDHGLDSGVPLHTEHHYKDLETAAGTGQDSEVSQEYEPGDSNVDSKESLIETAEPLSLAEQRQQDYQRMKDTYGDDVQTLREEVRMEDFESSPDGDEVTDVYEHLPQQEPMRPRGDYRSISYPDRDSGGGKSEEDFYKAHKSQRFPDGVLMGGENPKKDKWKENTANKDLSRPEKKQTANSKPNAADNYNKIFEEDTVSDEWEAAA